MEFVYRATPKNFNYFLLGDLHIGSILHHNRGFDTFIDMMGKPYADVKHNIVTFKGDLIEAIDTSDKRFDADATDLTKIKPQLQMEYFVDRVKPIRKKIVTALQGNHEAKLQRYYDYTHGACDALDIPYGTYTSVITFLDRNGETMFKHFATHGYGSITSIADSPERRAANMKLSLKRKLANKAADCALMSMGHTHKLLTAEPESSLYLRSDGAKITQHYTEVPQNAPFIPRDLRWYINTGSLMRLYRRGFSGYAERAQYDPMELGFPIVRVRDGVIVGVDKVIV